MRSDMIDRHVRASYKRRPHSTTTVREMASELTHPRNVLFEYFSSSHKYDTTITDLTHSQVPKSHSFCFSF